MKNFKLFVLIFTTLYLKNSFAKDFFNPQFLGEDAASLENLSDIMSGSQISPGEYYLYLYSGEQYIKNMKILFSKSDGKVQPCFTKETIDILPLNSETKKRFLSLNNINGSCIDVSLIIENFSYEVDLSKLIIRLYIPQIYLDNAFSTMAPESEWDDGITAFLVNYNYNGSYSKNKTDENYNSNFLSINNRFNYGPWRFNGDIYYNENKYGSNSSHTIETNNIFLSRKINPIKSEVLLGQSTLGSNLFESNSYIGITLATSNEMLPDSDRGYSPSIRGTAESRSKLTIKQNNTIVYQTYVNPGPYNIDNLNAVGTSGDYEVELTSSEGIIKRYFVPYSSLPNLLRPKKFNYSLTFGKLDLNSSKDVDFFQGSFSLGVPFETTVFLGTQIAQDYSSMGIGLGKNLGKFGAVSIDAVNAISQIDEDRFAGESYRALYSKSFMETGTNIQLTGYRYSTSDYYTLAEASRSKTMSNNDFENYYYGKRKDSFQVNLSQSLNEFGQFYIWGNINSYWGTDKKSKNIQIGWNKNFSAFKNINVSASFSKKSYNGMTDDVFYLTFSLPLASAQSKNKLYLSNGLNYDNSAYSNSTSLYGNVLEDKINYNLYQTTNKNSSYNNTNINVEYKANSSTSRFGYIYSNQTQQIDYGLSGGILLHEGGVAFSRLVNESSILVEAKGAEGAVVNRTGENIKIDSSGYALLTYATPYHYNDVEIDPESFSSDFNIDNKILKTAPTKGAISKVTFDVKKGYNFLAYVNYKGKNLKFGTLVKNNQNKNVSIVDDDGSVYLTGVNDKSSYTAILDDNITCNFKINYTSETFLKSINRQTLTCL